MSGKIVIIGFGSIGQAILPLLKKTFQHYRAVVIEQAFISSYQTQIIKENDLESIEIKLSQPNYKEVLTPFLNKQDFLLNLATSVSSEDLIQFAQTKEAFYIDTSIEPWDYEHQEEGIATSNYFLR